ncbi:MAG: radical SAM protein [bacterium]
MPITLIQTSSRSRTTGSRTISRKIEKVLLFRSPLVYHQHIGHEDPHPPLELLYLAASLKSEYDLKILDGQRQTDTVEDFGKQKRMGLSDSRIVQESIAFQPDLIGISITWHHQIPAALYFARLLKKNLPDALIVAGGIGPSSSSETLLRSRDVDFVISGEGEDAIVRLCRTLKRGGDLSQVPGLSFRDDDACRSNAGNGSSIISIPRQSIADPDSVPFPAIELISLGDYDSGYRHGIHKAYPMMGILSSRGCPLACHFCSLPAVSNRLFRTRPVERLISDMLRLRDEFGIRELHFYDDNMINEPQFSKRLFQAMIDHRIGLPWLPEAGFALWKIDPELLDLARASGMYRLDLPIETGSDRVKGEIMDKGLYHNQQVAAVVKRARQAGIEKIFGYVIVGSPGETIEDIKCSLDLINALDLDYRGIRFAQPFPGTKFYDICVDNGFLTADFSLDRLWFTIPNIETGNFTPAELSSLIAADRAAAMIRQGRITYQDGIEEIKVKHSDRIAQDAASLIPELQSRYQSRVRRLKAEFANL